MFSLYEVIDGKKIPIQFRKRGKLKIDPCIFCGDNHEHSEGEGHRSPHCKSYRDRSDPEGIKLDDGTIAEKRDGYILKYRD